MLAPSGVGQFAGHRDDIDQSAVAPDRDFQAAANHVLDHMPLDRRAADDVLATDGDDDVSDPQASLVGRAPRYHLGDPQPGHRPGVSDDEMILIPDDPYDESMWQDAQSETQHAQ